MNRPERSPGFLLWHVTLRWQRDVTSALKPLGLTHVQSVLLATTWWLTEHGEQPTQVQLADAAGTDVKMTSQVIRTLATRGLVIRASSPGDARVRHLDVSAAGAELAPRAIEAVETVDRALLARLPSTGRRSFSAALRQLREP